MALKEPIVIKDWKNGQAMSPYEGFGAMRNLDIHSLPGIVRPNFAAVKQSGTTITGVPYWKVRATTTGDHWCLDSDQKVYKSTNGGVTWSLVTGNTATGNGNGLAYWKNYIFVTYNLGIDVYGPLTSSPSWTTAWQPLSSGDTVFNPIFAAETDDVIYFGGTRYIDSLLEKTNKTFLPSDATTYNFTAKALTLPSDYTIRCMALHTKNLMIGTTRHTPSNVVMNYADVFPWDRISNSYNAPFSLDHDGVNQMLGINNMLFIQAGSKGNFYMYNGYAVMPLNRITLDLFTDPISLTFYPGAIMYYKGKIYSGVSGGAFNSRIQSGAGVWSINTPELGYQTLTAGNSVYNFENQISTGETGANNLVRIGSLLPIGEDAYLIGWQDTQNSSQGVDLVSQTVRYSSYKAYCETPMYRVGTKSKPEALGNIEFQLDRPLEAGQGLALYYRTDLSASYTQIGSNLDFAALGAVQSWIQPLSITVESVQFKCAITTNADTKSPRLKELIIQ